MTNLSCDHQSLLQYLFCLRIFFFKKQDLPQIEKGQTGPLSMAKLTRNGERILERVFAPNKLTLFTQCDTQIDEQDAELLALPYLACQRNAFLQIGFCPGIVSLTICYRTQDSEQGARLLPILPLKGQYPSFLQIGFCLNECSRLP